MSGVLKDWLMVLMLVPTLFTGLRLQSVCALAPEHFCCCRAQEQAQTPVSCCGPEVADVAAVSGCDCLLEMAEGNMEALPGEASRPCMHAEGTFRLLAYETRVFRATETRTFDFPSHGNGFLSRSPHVWLQSWRC